MKRKRIPKRSRAKIFDMGYDKPTIDDKTCKYFDEVFDFIDNLIEVERPKFKSKTIFNRSSVRTLEKTLVTMRLCIQTLHSKRQNLYGWRRGEL